MTSAILWAPPVGCGGGVARRRETCAPVRTCRKGAKFTARAGLILGLIRLGVPKSGWETMAVVLLLDLTAYRQWGRSQLAHIEQEHGACLLLV